MALETKDATFETEVLKADKRVLVDFWAPWCGPCRMLGPIIENISQKAAGKAYVFKMNVDENPETAAKYSITGIPTVIIFNEGKVAQQLVGVQPEQTYMRALGI